MKIIEGPRADKTYRIRCNKPRCMALVEVQERELRTVHDQRYGNAFVMNCPACSQDTWIDQNKISVYEYKA